MTRCKIPKGCERFKIDIGIYDVKSKRQLPRSVEHGDVCVYIQRNPYCVIWKKKVDKVVYLMC